MKIWNRRRKQSFIVVFWFQPKINIVHGPNTCKTIFDLSPIVFYAIRNDVFSETFSTNKSFLLFYTFENITFIENISIYQTLTLFRRFGDALLKSCCYLGILFGLFLVVLIYQALEPLRKLIYTFERILSLVCKF